MRAVLKIFKALSDGQRLRILKMLELRPLCVCEITEILNLANSTVSKHLSILREAELILDEKEGKWVNYARNSTAASPYVRDILESTARWLTEDPQILADAQSAKKVNRDVICRR